MTGVAVRRRPFKMCTLLQHAPEGLHLLLAFCFREGEAQQLQVCLSTGITLLEHIRTVEALLGTANRFVPT